MAKRKNHRARKIGLEPNMLCPHCGRKVKQTHRLIRPEGEYVVLHWWSVEVCYSSAKVREYLKLTQNKVEVEHA